jgi:hypothetical protein
VRRTGNRSPPCRSKALLKKGANTIVAVAKNAGKGPNAAGFFFDCRIRMPDGKEIKLASDSSWEWTPQVPASGKEGRLGAFDAKDWKPVTVVKALPVWQKVIDSQAPAHPGSERKCQHSA